MRRSESVVSCSGQVDWRPALYELLAVMGHATLTAYARVRPTATLEALSWRLGAGAIAARQLRDSLVEEAFRAAEIEACARDLLVRTVHGLPAGWPASFDTDGRRQAGAALLEWTASFQDPTFQGVLARIAQALLLDMTVPFRWKPAGIADGAIAAPFAHYWPRMFRQRVAVYG